MEFKESKSKWKDSLADGETLEEMTPEELAEEVTNFTWRYLLTTVDDL